MASPFQQAVTRRKWAYFLLIVALFTVSLYWRGKIELPLADKQRATYLNQLRVRGSVDPEDVPAPAPNAIAHAADWLYSRTLEQQASNDALELRELDQGDPEITSTVMRLGTLGSRGFVITLLWRAAIEKFKRNEWHDFEFLVRTVTRLQPNFTTPWIYQSWNLSYNVSVENDRLNDMYFYITRGIELLAEGERMNRKSPDMRYQIGFYYQNKFSVADKVRTLSSLFQLSSIPPDERKASRFRNPKTGQIDLDTFGEFARKNPQLCRRLVDQLGYARPEQIVQFLEDNYSVPSRFDAAQNDRLRRADEAQFPTLPPRTPTDGESGIVARNFPFTSASPAAVTNDSFDAFQAAGAWYAYSLEPLPPPPGEGTPKFTAELAAGADQFRYRIPKSPMMILFRQAGPRVQTYRAERLSKEAWFEDATNWAPDVRADTDADRWFPKANVQLTTPVNSKAEWARAADMWDHHARVNGLRLEPVRLATLLQLANGVPDDLALERMPDDQLLIRGLTRERVNAKLALRAYYMQLPVTNVEFYLLSSEVERDPLAIEARKAIWDARQADQAGNKLQAKKLYAEGINLFRQLLRKFPGYHHLQSMAKGEEDLYEYQVRLARILELDADVDRMARAQAAALRGFVPFADEEITRQVTAQELAGRVAGVMVTALDPRVQARADELLAAFKDKDRAAEIQKQFPAVAQGKDALVRWLVTDGPYKHLWVFMSEGSTEDANKWISRGTVDGMADRIKELRKTGQ